ncbi:cupin domain-containing protein [Alkalibacillus haloalkaliphilus]|uniref:cupin domain-containing protein n=1 Tax=Alkalibacillus haloalkaliphilus TaxID=94136 RepID=UPI0029365B84|nr:cupin domain-containing protein [Alkalibacillus haloalkaliphilus]MDV2582176.1 cupin domain-containing protein [Alkalibacillus haloalkaliphilus]
MVKNCSETQYIEKPHGGVGAIEITRVLSSEDTLGHVSLLAKVTVHPNSTIGYHQHIGEAEAYYLLKGKGYFINAKEERVPVQSGDVCTIEVGQSHGLENPYDESIEMIALVYPEKN